MIADIKASNNMINQFNILIEQCCSLSRYDSFHSSRRFNLLTSLAIEPRVRRPRSWPRLAHLYYWSKGPDSPFEYSKISQDVRFRIHSITTTSRPRQFAHSKVSTARTSMRRLRSVTWKSRASSSMTGGSSQCSPKALTPDNHNTMRKARC